VLLRTWLSLQGRGLLNWDGGTLAVPGEIEAVVEETYGADEPLTPAGPWQAALAEGRRVLEREHEEERAEARDRWTPEPEAGLLDHLALLTTATVQEDRPDIDKRWQALTRLAPPGVTLILLRPDEQEEADRLTGAWRRVAEVYRRHRRNPVEPRGSWHTEGKLLGEQRLAARTRLERFMLERAMEVTRYDVYAHWRAQPTPPFWDQSPALRHAWRVDLELVDGAMRFTGGGPLLTLDPTLGLTVQAAP